MGLKRMVGDKNNNADKMSKEFNITSLCRGDIIQMIDNHMTYEDELRKLMLIKEVGNITDDEMKNIASKLSDGFCNCCFWDILDDRFEQLIKEKTWQRLN